MHADSDTLSHSHLSSVCLLFESPSSLRQISPTSHQEAAVVLDKVISGYRQSCGRWLWYVYVSVCVVSSATGSITIKPHFTDKRLRHRKVK